MGSEVFTVLRVAIVVAWIMAPCSPVSCTKVLDKFTASTNILPEVGGTSSMRIFGDLVLDYTASYSRCLHRVIFFYQKKTPSFTAIQCNV